MRYTLSVPHANPHLVLGEEPLIKGSVKVKKFKIPMGSWQGLKILTIGPKGGKIVGYDSHHKPIYAGSKQATKLAAIKKQQAAEKAQTGTVGNWLLELGVPSKAFMGKVRVSEAAGKLIEDAFGLSAKAEHGLAVFQIEDLVPHVGEPLKPAPEEHLSWAAYIAAGQHEDESFPDLDTLKPIPAGKYAGSHGNLAFKDPKGRVWIFKGENPTIARAEEAASRIGRLILGTKKVPPAKYVQINGKDGVLIGEVPGEPMNEHSHSDPPTSALVKWHADVVKHQVLDWLTSNHDGHAGNYLVTTQGINAIDKGQAWKWFGKDKLAPSYKGENPSWPIFHKFWNEVVPSGKIPHEGLIKAAAEAIDAAEKITTKQYQQIVAPYTATAAGLTGKDPATQAKALAGRLETLRSDFEAFLSEQLGKPVKLPKEGADNFETMPEGIKEPGMPAKVEGGPAQPVPDKEPLPGWPLAKGKVTVHAPGDPIPAAGKWPKGLPGPGFTLTVEYKGQMHTLEVKEPYGPGHKNEGKPRIVVYYPDGSSWDFPSLNAAGDSLYLHKEGLPLSMTATEKKAKKISLGSKVFKLKDFKGELSAAKSGGELHPNEMAPKELESAGVVEPGAKSVSVWDLLAKVPDGVLGVDDQPPEVLEFATAAYATVGTDYGAAIPPGVAVKVVGGVNKDAMALAAFLDENGEPKYHLWTESGAGTGPYNPNSFDSTFNLHGDPKLKMLKDALTVSVAKTTDEKVGVAPKAEPNDATKVPGSAPKSYPGPLPPGASHTTKKKFPWGKSDVMLVVGDDGKTYQAIFMDADGTAQVQEFKSLSAASDWVWVNQKGYPTAEAYKAATGKKKVASGGGWKFWGLDTKPKAEVKEPPANLEPTPKSEDNFETMPESEVEDDATQVATSSLAPSDLGKAPAGAMVLWDGGDGDSRFATKRSDGAWDIKNAEDGTLMAQGLSNVMLLKVLAEHPAPDTVEVSGFTVEPTVEEEDDVAEAGTWSKVPLLTPTILQNAPIEATIQMGMPSWSYTKNADGTWDKQPSAGGVTTKVLGPDVMEDYLDEHKGKGAVEMWTPDPGAHGTTGKPTKTVAAAHHVAPGEHAYVEQMDEESLSFLDNGSVLTVEVSGQPNMVFQLIDAEGSKWAQTGVPGQPSMVSSDMLSHIMGELDDDDIIGISLFKSDDSLENKVSMEPDPAFFAALDVEGASLAATVTVGYDLWKHWDVLPGGKLMEMNTGMMPQEFNDLPLGTQVMTVHAETAHYENEKYIHVKTGPHTWTTAEVDKASNPTSDSGSDILSAEVDEVLVGKGKAYIWKPKAPKMAAKAPPTVPDHIHTDGSKLPEAVADKMSTAWTQMQTQGWLKPNADGVVIASKSPKWAAWTPPMGVLFEGEHKGKKYYFTTGLTGYNNEGEAGDKYQCVILEEDGTNHHSSSVAYPSAALKQAAEKAGIDVIGIQNLKDMFGIGTTYGQNETLETIASGIGPSTLPDIADDPTHPEDMTPEQKEQPVKMTTTLQEALKHHPSLAAHVSTLQVKPAKKVNHTNIIINAGDTEKSQELLNNIATEYGFTSEVIHAGNKAKASYYNDGAFMTVPNWVLQQEVVTEAPAHEAASAAPTVPWFVSELMEATESAEPVANWDTMPEGFPKTVGFMNMGISTMSEYLKEAPLGTQLQLVSGAKLEKTGPDAWGEVGGGVVGDSVDAAFAVDNTAADATVVPPMSKAPEPKKKKAKPKKKGPTAAQKKKAKEAKKKAEAIAAFAKASPAIKGDTAQIAMAHLQTYFEVYGIAKPVWGRMSGADPDHVLLGSADEADKLKKLLVDTGNLNGKDFFEVEEVETALGTMFKVPVSGINAALKLQPVKDEKGEVYPPGTTFETKTISETKSELLKSAAGFTKVAPNKSDDTKVMLKWAGTGSETATQAKAALALLSIKPDHLEPIVGSHYTMYSVDKGALDETIDRTEVEVKTPKQPPPFVPASLPTLYAAEGDGAIAENNFGDLAVIDTIKPPMFGHTIRMGKAGELRDFQVAVRKVRDTDGKLHYEFSGKLQTFSPAKAQLSAGYMSYHTAMTGKDPVSGGQVLGYDEETGEVQEGSGTIRSYSGYEGLTDGGSKVDIVRDNAAAKALENTFRIRIPADADVESELRAGFEKLGRNPDKAVASPTAKDERVFIKSQILRSYYGAKGWYKAIPPATFHNEKKLDEALAAVGMTDAVQTATIRKSFQGKHSVYLDDQDRIKEQGALYAFQGMSKWGAVLQIAQGAGNSSRVRRYLMGVQTHGASASEDEGSGGANTSFWRIGNDAVKTNSWGLGCDFEGDRYGMIAHPRVFSRTDMYAYGSDNYGTTWHGGNGDINSAKKRYDSFYVTNSSNEVCFEDGVSLKDAAGLTAPSQAEKDSLITILKGKGVTEVNGIPLDKFIVVFEDGMSRKQLADKVYGLKEGVLP